MWASFQGTKVICLGLLPTHNVSVVNENVKARLLQFRRLVGSREGESGLLVGPSCMEANFDPYDN